MGNRSKHLTTEMMAAELGIGVRRLNRLAALGTVPRVGPNRWDRGRVTDAYHAFLRKPRAGREPSPEMAKIQNRLTVARAKLLEHRLAEREAALVPRADVNAHWEEAVAAVKARCARFAADVAPKVFGLSSIPGVAAVLTNEVHNLLTDLSELDFGEPEEIKERAESAGRGAT